MRIDRTALFITLMLLLLPLPARAHTETPPEIRFILDSMSPAERVGQLFLVTFGGTDTSSTSQIHDLVTRRHIGGVVLLSSNDNIAPAPDTVLQAHSLIRSLQQLEWDASRSPSLDPITNQEIATTYVPLFIGIKQEGNGYPTDQILSGLTALPSQMAIGATWKPELASIVGEVKGRELAALGVNLLFGPSLDVMDLPSAISGDLGTRVFGGDPFWVGEMGRAYVAGLHSGSSNKLLVIAKHFPGVGGSDRLPEDEVSTVRKSLEQLKQIELAPFFAVTGNAPSPESKVDGLMASHIRYQGLQGNIRATTRPVSFDTQALGQILALPQFTAWREAGGLIVSDDVGTDSVRDFYAQGGSSFSARIAARDAFLAGNDLIYLGNIVSPDTVDTYSAVIRILEFFTQKYQEDTAFAQRVDQSVARILAVKFKLYESFVLSRVLAPERGLTPVGSSGALIFDVARDSATLISPPRADLATVLPNPPQVDERLVFLTDTVNIKQCTLCAEQPSIPLDALQQAVLSLYGPQSGEQTTGFRLSSYSFGVLVSMLDQLDPPFIEEDLNRADWVVISVSDASQGQPAVVRRFLRERPDLLSGKRVIVFSFDAPYYFDATDISKFTAYFALYSKQPQFVDVAARLLFQELTPTSASPVSISGIGYDLISMMTPSPDQVIPLSLDLPPLSIPTGTPNTPEPTNVPLYKIGDIISIRTGVIKDHNGHAVPDGTVVQFSMVLKGEGGGILQQVAAETVQGVARASFGLEKPGLLEIRASSEPAVISEVLQLDVSQTGSVAVTVVVPELTQPSEVTPIPEIESPERVYITEAGYPRLSSWIIAMIFIAMGVSLAYFAGIRLSDIRSARRWALGIVLGGLAAYNVLAFGFFGFSGWLKDSGLAGLLLCVFFGEMAGFTGAWIWVKRSGDQRKALRFPGGG